MAPPCICYVLLWLLVCRTEAQGTYAPFALWHEAELNPVPATASSWKPSWILWISLSYPISPLLPPGGYTWVVSFGEGCAKAFVNAMALQQCILTRRLHLQLPCDVAL